MLLKQDHGWQLHSVSNQGARKQKYVENVEASHRQENMRKTPTEAHKNQKKIEAQQKHANFALHTFSIAIPQIHQRAR